MPSCPHPNCDWQPIAPTTEGALEQITTHLFETHAGEGDDAGDGDDFRGASVEVTREDGVWEFAPADAVESARDDEE